MPISRQTLPTVFVLAALLATGAHAAENEDRYRCGSSKPEEAIVACGRVIGDKWQPQPVRWLALRNRGYAYQVRGDLPKALADYDAVLRIGMKDLDPRELGAQDRRGERRARINVLNAQTHVNRGMIRARMGDRDAALADYAQAIAMAPDLSTPYLNRAAIYLQAGDSVRALADLNAAIVRAHADPSAYVSRGGAYRNLGQADKAVADYGTAIALGGGDPQVYRERGLANADDDTALRLDPRLAGR